MWTNCPESVQPALHPLMSALLSKSSEYCCNQRVRFKDQMLLLHSLSQAKLHFLARWLNSHKKWTQLPDQTLKGSLAKQWTLCLFQGNCFWMLFVNTLINLRNGKWLMDCIILCVSMLVNKAFCSLPLAGYPFAHWWQERCHSRWPDLEIRSTFSVLFRDTETHGLREPPQPTLWKSALPPQLLPDEALKTHCTLPADQQITS